MNRIAVENDIAQYGSYINVGDIILDTPTRDNGSLNYYFIGEEFPKLPNWDRLNSDPTIWFDGNLLGNLFEIKLQNSVYEKPWPFKMARFRNIPGTEVRAKSLSSKGMEYLDLAGHGSISKWPSSRKFLTGSFGFHISQDGLEGHCYDISVQDGGSISMSGFEAQGGFAGLRIQSKNRAVTVNGLNIDEFYIHDTMTGEGTYIGSTVAGTVTPKFKNVRIKNGIVARTAAEALQHQHMAGSDVHNITIFAADTDWLNGFQPNQSTCLQFNAAEGINRLHNILVDGYGNSGINPFSVNPIDYKPEAVNESLIYDILMYGGRACGSYMNLSMKNGVEWKFNNIMYGGFNGSWYEHTGNIVRPMIHSGPLTDKVSFGRLIHDGSKSPLFDKTYDIKELIEQNIPAPKYHNSGFHEPSSYIMRWAQHYATYHGVPENTPTVWKPGMIAIHDGFYKALKYHLADVQPKDSPNFMKLSWDSEGVRSDQENWNNLSVQSNLPPDDLRLAPGSPYSHLGIQVRENIVEEYYENGTRVTLTDAGNKYYGI